jgi:hypothetical protein
VYDFTYVSLLQQSKMQDADCSHLLGRVLICEANVDCAWQAPGQGDHQVQLQSRHK